MAPYLASARGSFQLLMRDYEAALEYIHPVDGHGKVYSHGTFALLLRACTEFEGLAKEGAIERGIVKRSEQPNINALSPLSSRADLVSVLQRR